ncbi:Protein of unknown function [Pedobacter steynii]|uniref:Right handed beta helix domain-containing protein n=1 Tax=Pedobacter steynii TaxID=430522 RepID=A0A1G9NMM4_9SPHI|nr:right-handed parallel beta-helix repeat-containing protein [Pedobacter steynii]NQX39262.1 right-handed parallel beta-helix repeat-containing protein [Pedobacter steynii]SDL87255.1 Protein of unknown function [Pedobacter steynii]
MKPSAFLSLVLVVQTLVCTTKTSAAIPKTKDKPRKYYVAVNGADTNTGSLNSPFQTINIALSHAAPGDQVLVRGGTYYQEVKFPRSGVPEKTISLQRYPGEKPVIDGSKITVTGWQALVTLNNVSYVTIDGFDICNLHSAVGNTDPQGMAIIGSGQHITVKNCNIYNIKNNTTLAQGRSGHAILAIGNGVKPISNLLITGCTVHDTQTGTSENVTLAGNIDGFTFSHNQVYDTENIGVIVAGGDGLNPHGAVESNYARNGIIRDNVFHHNTMTKTPETWGPDRFGAISIYVCGGANTLIERNIVYESDRGIGLVSESNIYPTRTTTVKNNLVYNCYRAGIYMGDYLNYTIAGTKNCAVLNNTLFQNNRVPGAFGEIEGELRLTEHCDSNVIKYNKVYAGPKDVMVHKYTLTGSHNLIDHNSYFSTGQPQWIWNSTNGAPITDFQLWKKTSGQDASSSLKTVSTKFYANLIRKWKRSPQSKI